MVEDSPMRRDGRGIETLSAVALRAFRSPISGLATMLASLTSDLNANIAAVHLVPPEPSDPIEMLATGGPQAATLGPPGRLSDRTGAPIRSLLGGLAAGEQLSGALGATIPWTTHAHTLSTVVMLDDQHVCLLTVAGDDPIDAVDLYECSAIIGLLTQMAVHRRDIERLRQELRTVRQDRSLLTAGLHHDLKGPLTAILGSAQTLIQRSDELEEDTKASFLGAIRTQAERLNRMLVDTLERQAADPNASVKKMSVRITDLAERVAATAMAMRSGEVIVESPGIWIVTDPDRLERALLNLVDNALRYGPPDIPVYVIVEQDASAVSITVADNGPGVAPEVLPGLFSAYATDPGRTDGTGLGLHSVRTIADQLGGRVAYARHSEWTRFTLVLPQDDAS